MKMYYTQTAPTTKSLDTVVQTLINDGWSLRGEQYFAQGKFYQVLVKGENRRKK